MHVNLVVPAVLGLGALFVMVIVARLRARAEANSNTQEPQGRILIHSINDDRCTGCDACVAVCPTNVLDLIDNKSRVLRFQDCIQCEACAWACPTTALVMHLEGTKPPPVMAPLIDENYQTEVAGQYLIGEVAGKPLVKNAANLGRGVIEHMLRTGLKPQPLPNRAEGSDASEISVVDVAIVGSGPGGLSAALTCIQQGLRYVVLEKSQTIASTIAYYPKGKLIMAEPYDCDNLSLLPAFDSSKEKMMELWRNLVKQTKLHVQLGESVEAVRKRATGDFDIRTNVSAYRAQRVVLATGTRGKPRTLNVPGENLPKVHSLLDDPDDFRGQAVLIAGGGDSALEAALALADAGASVTLSYRGRQFARASMKNKKAIESYAASKRLKVIFQSEVTQFSEQAVVIMTKAGEQKIPNSAAFVLIGANPPIEWLGTLGVKFQERPHEYAPPPSDMFVRKFLGEDATHCPETIKPLLALIQNRPLTSSRQVPVERNKPNASNQAHVIAKSSLHGKNPSRSKHVGGNPTGLRKWLRDATAIFSWKAKKNMMPPKARPHAAAFSTNAANKPRALNQRAHVHRDNQRGAGKPRRDALDTNERTRVLRMLRDEGGRLADEDSKLTNLFGLEQEFEKRLIANSADAHASTSQVNLSKDPTRVAQLEVGKLARQSKPRPANQFARRQDHRDVYSTGPKPNAGGSSAKMPPARANRALAGSAGPNHPLLAKQAAAERQRATAGRNRGVQGKTSTANANVIRRKANITTTQLGQKPATSRPASATKSTVNPHVVNRAKRRQAATRSVDVSEIAQLDAIGQEFSNQATRMAPKPADIDWGDKDK